MQKSCALGLLTVLMCGICRGADGLCDNSKKIESGIIDGNSRIVMQGEEFTLRGGGSITVSPQAEIIGRVKIEPPSNVFVEGGHTYDGPATLEAGLELGPVKQGSTN